MKIADKLCVDTSKLPTALELHIVTVCELIYPITEKTSSK